MDKYDFENGAKELANRRWGWNLKVHLDDDRDICSDYASRYVINLDIVNNVFKSKTIVFPEDYFRYLILERAKVLN